MSLKKIKQDTGEIEGVDKYTKTSLIKKKKISMSNVKNNVRL